MVRQDMSRLSKEQRKQLRRDAELAQQSASNNDSSDSPEFREQIYEEHFGECRTVAHDTISIVPHIDVYIFEPQNAGRDFFTLVTSGLSEFQATGGFGRSELIFYSKEAKDEYISMLRNLAHAIIANNIDAGHGNTLTNGVPPEPLFKNSPLSCILLHETGVEPECDRSDEWEIDGEPVFLLNVMPISESECDFIKSNDVAEFVDLLEDHPEIDDEIFLGPRESVV